MAITASQLIATSKKLEGYKASAHPTIGSMATMLAAVLLGARRLFVIGLIRQVLAT